MITSSSFKAPFWAKNKHIQTILPRLFLGSKKLSIEWQDFPTPDGDFVELAWMPEIRQQECKGIVVLFHGLEGSVDSHYASDFMQFFHQKGLRCVMMHFRGCGRKENNLPRSYHSGDTHDAKLVLRWLRQMFPEQAIFALGFSLGANMLLKLLGEESGQTWVDRAVAVSPPFRLGECSQSISKGFSRVYQSHLVRSMKNRFAVKSASHDFESLLQLTQDKLRSLDNFFDFDDAITAPLHGFASANDYYERCSAIGFLKQISTPTLVLHAKDDPFMHPDIVPHEDDLSQSVQLELSEKGGHVGFIYGTPFRLKKWLHGRTLEYFSTGK